MREAVECVGEHIGLHDHPMTSTGRRVVNGAMFVIRMRSDVDRIE
jgi:hypothetical protein